MAVTKYAFANIKNYLGKEYKFKDKNGTEHTIPAGTATATIAFDTEDLGQWKADSTSSDNTYIGVRYLSGSKTKKTSGLPAAADGVVYLVPADVCAVAKIMEDRNDVITPADLIRAKHYDNNYVYFE